VRGTLEQSGIRWFHQDVTRQTIELFRLKCVEVISPVERWSAHLSRNNSSGFAIVTTYLYGLLVLDIYMKVPKGLDTPNKNHSRTMYCVKLQKSFYGLKSREEYGTTD
jgi:hypothetical protein